MQLLLGQLSEEVGILLISSSGHNAGDQPYCGPSIHGAMIVPYSVTRKKSPNVYKSCLKMISLEKLKILTPIQKLPKNVGDLGKWIVAKGFRKLPKVQLMARSGHTGSLLDLSAPVR